MTDEERERRAKRLLGPSAEQVRDEQVARETVRDRSQCPHCNPPARPVGDMATRLVDFGEEDGVAELPAPREDLLDYIPHVQDRNLQRGLFAGLGLRAYAERTRCFEALDIVGADFLGDLRHLCDAAGMDFDALVEQGRRHYEAEIGGGG